ncbi:cellulase family glycosylhydrolase [Priestia megaterium]
MIKIKKNFRFKKYKTPIFILLFMALIFFIFIKPFPKEKKSYFPKEIPNGFGVNIHFTGNPIDIDLIKDAGFNIVRQDIYWNNVESKPGKFDFKNTGYDELTNALIAKNIKPYYILDYSNELYEKDQSIVTKKGQDAFVRYVSQVTSRYKDKGIIWEIWNEPNGSFWEPKPNYKEYSSLVKIVSKTIRENDPSGIIVAPAVSELNEKSSKWLEEIFKEGILDYIDCVSVHPYRGEIPETVAYDYQNLRHLINKYKEKDIPILSGEWGYSTTRGWRNLNLDDQKQAEYLVRMFLTNLLSDVPVSIWYDWKNDGEDPLNAEHNFGLRQYDVNFSKKSYVAINTMTYYLSKFKLNKRIDLHNPNDYMLEFTRKDKTAVIVYWTTENTHQINIPDKYKQGKIITMYGHESGNIEENTSKKLEISNSPTYIITNK